VSISFAEQDITKRVYVSFRIRSDKLDPTEITTRLGIQPSRAWAKGEKYLGKIGDPVNRKISEVWRPRPWGVWDIHTEEQGDIREARQHILNLVNILEPHKEALRYYLERPDEYTISFYSYFEPLDGVGSYVIPSELLVRMAELSHFVEFQFFHVESAREENEL
jgi:hypothetical protein